MSRHVCSVPGCPTISDHTRCPTHRAEARRQRGTTTEQGYGWQHQRRRDALIPQAIGKPCPDCGDLMVADVVADHSIPLSVDLRSVADRVHCRSCSNKQGGRIRQQNK